MHNREYRPQNSRTQKRVRIKQGGVFVYPEPRWGVLVCNKNKILSRALIPFS